jgi:hypothetical protein
VRTPILCQEKPNPGSPARKPQKARTHFQPSVEVEGEKGDMRDEWKEI